MPNIRKPNKLHEVSGTKRADRHGEEGTTLDDVENLGQLPPCPSYLGDVAREEWHRVVSILEPYGLLKATDYGIMIGYCKLFEIINTSDSIRASTIAQFRGVCNDLGLTPVARSKIKNPQGKPNADNSGNPYSEF